MAPYIKICQSWVRQHVGWSNSWQSWQERIGGALLLAAAATLLWFASQLSLTQQVVLWGIWVLVLATLMRRGWLKLFGPVLFYDMVRTARRTRYIVLRCCYAAFLMLVLFWIYLSWLVDRSNSPWDFITGASLQSRDMAIFAESFFFTFMSIQFVAVGLLTPAYTAGAIAEEKDRKTLEFLLATDLRNREIVLSKLASRLINLSLFVVTGLPILSLMQFLGGVDPDLVLASFAATALAMFSLASFGILNSVLLRKPLHAIVLTYLGAFAYLAISGMSWLVPLGISALPASALTSWLAGIAQTCVDWLNAGNIFSIIIQLVWSLESGGRLDESLPDMLRDYAIFHGLIILVCTTWAVLRLRQIALKQSYGQAMNLAFDLRLFGRPRIGSFPMLWKELFAEPGVGRSCLLRVIVLGLVLASFVPLVAILVTVCYAWLYSNFSGREWREVTYFINGFHVRFATTCVECLLLLAVGIRAAGSISGERDRQTFDGLLTSPLNSDSILFAKWVGSIASVRWGWLWIGVMWMLGVALGGMHVMALPLVIGAWLVFAGFIAMLGLWFSMVCRSTLRAILWTLISVIALCFGHYLFIGCGTTALLIMTGGGGTSDIAGWILMFETYGMTPPITMGFLAFHGEEFESTSYWRPFDAWPSLVSALTGLFCWGMLAVMLGGLASDRFRRMTGRSALRRPERGTVPRKARPVPTAAPLLETHIQQTGRDGLADENQEVHRQAGLPEVERIVVDQVLPVENNDRPMRETGIQRDETK